MFQAGFSPIIRSLKNCIYSLGYCHAFLLSTAGVDGLELFQPENGGKNRLKHAER
jgi:hypothetical protein